MRLQCLLSHQHSASALVLINEPLRLSFVVTDDKALLVFREGVLLDDLEVCRIFQIYELVVSGLS